ncbi:DUF3108 domain-containing protein [Tepidiphilus succinatimandens]|uniref:DUF3108 domain-containing protein n=1 Tax=Tepidiphilus succinatimandens TaxID=224436 RepID=UPI001476EA50|nr:DUF3108 domain-containing protein [Tepidiphilus succinatimandens]
MLKKILVVVGMLVAASAFAAESQRLVYRVLSGERGLQIGQADLAWTLSDDGRYTMTLQLQSTGLVALVAQVNEKRTSNGTWDAKTGFHPLHYERLRSGKPPEMLDFDWKARTVRSTRKGKTVDLPLTDHEQDYLSLMHQLGFLRQKGPREGKIAVVTGKRIKQATYRVEPQPERLKLDGLGEIPVQRITARTVEGDFAMTVWWQSEPASRPVRLLIEAEDGVFDHWLQP